MNIYQLSVKSGISLTTLRKLEKLGALKVSGETEFLDRLIFHMRGHQTLTVAQLLGLIEKPDTLDDLAAVKPRYAKRAREQLAMVGNPLNVAVPREVTAALPDASRGDDDAGLIIAEWIKSVVDLAPVPHAWIAVRLLAPLNEFMREQIAPLITVALLNVRKLPELAGYWHSEKIGSRSVIFYHARIDNLDL